MSRFIELPTGDQIRSDLIQAVRIGEPNKEYNLSWRVIIDFGVNYTNSVTIDLPSLKDCKTLVDSISSYL